MAGTRRRGRCYIQPQDTAVQTTRNEQRQHRHTCLSGDQRRKNDHRKRIGGFRIRQRQVAEGRLYQPSHSQSDYIRTHIRPPRQALGGHRRRWRERICTRRTLDYKPQQNQRIAFQQRDSIVHGPGRTPLDCYDERIVPREGHTSARKGGCVWCRQRPGRCLRDVGGTRQRGNFMDRNLLAAGHAQRSYGQVLQLHVELGSHSGRLCGRFGYIGK